MTVVRGESDYAWWRVGGGWGGEAPPAWSRGGVVGRSLVGGGEGGGARGVSNSNRVDIDDNAG